MRHEEAKFEKEDVLAIISLNWLIYSYFMFSTFFQSTTPTIIVKTSARMPNLYSNW